MDECGYYENEYIVCIILFFC